MNFVIELDDDLGLYLQQTASAAGVPIGEYLASMIEEDLQLSHEVDYAIEEAEVDVDGLDMPIVGVVRMLCGDIKYHRENARLLQQDSLTLWTLRKIDARRGDRSRDSFLCDLMDSLRVEAP